LIKRPFVRTVIQAEAVSLAGQGVSGMDQKGKFREFAVA
jgi:hypothetical protein